MGEEYLIDSNIVIGYLDGKIPAKGMALVNKIVDNVPNISVITKIEILRYNAPHNAYVTLVDFTNASIVHNLDIPVVDKTIEICKKHRIKLPDAIIAATAIVHNLILITRNESDFQNIKGLKVTNPWDV